MPHSKYFGNLVRNNTNTAFEFKDFTRLEIALPGFSKRKFWVMQIFHESLHCNLFGRRVDVNYNKVHVLLNTAIFLYCNEWNELSLILFGCGTRHFDLWVELKSKFQL